MAFIGKSPQAGNFIVLDSITTSATATYNLTRNSTAYFPASARNLIVSLNGITQAPDTAYSVSGSTITFSSALTSSDVIDYILVLGDVLSIGTPADNTVGESQLSYPLTNFSSTGIDDNATSTAVTIDSSQNTTFAGEVTVSKIISSTSANIAAAFTSTTTTAKLTITDANDTAFIDVNATRLGIGHASSASLQALQIEPTSAEAMRIDSNGNVGIGIDDPQATLHVKSSDANTKIGIWNSGTAAASRYAQLLLTQGSTFFGASDKSWQLVSSGQSDGTTQFEIQNWNGSAYTKNASFYEDGNVNMHYGVRFGSDTAAANALDDYEEGTFSPTFVPSGTGFSSISYSQQTGHYTKVGNLVSIGLRVSVSALTTGSASGYLMVGGLPFTASNTAYSSVVVGYSSNFNTLHPTGGEMGRGMTQAYLYAPDKASYTESCVPANLASTSHLYMSLTYYV